MRSSKNSPSSRRLRADSLFLSAFLLICLIPPNALTAETELRSDQDFLMKVQRDTAQYFIEFSDPRTGLTLDSSDRSSPSSIAATGFSLAVLAIAQSHGWISYQNAYGQILKTLETAYSRFQNEHGFFYHFLDPKTGRRVWGSEVSSIDTALFVAGALFAAQHYRGSPVEALARKIYERVDWKWMLNNSGNICMGWKPETGFLPYYWDSYSEHLILQALAIGSPTCPVPASTWHQWKRLEEEYRGKKIFYSYTGSLFTYQYAHAFIDFRKLVDNGINYFDNSRDATLANREFCLENSGEYKTYGENSWGLTACLGPGGYKAYGALPGQAYHDGTIAPYGSAASIVFTPEESIRALRALFDGHSERLYAKYGFKDGFNLDKNWYAYEHLGIDQGITVLMIENYLTENVWKKFMRLPPVQRWITLCKLRDSAEGPAGPKVPEENPAAL